MLSFLSQILGFSQICSLIESSKNTAEEEENLAMEILKSKFQHTSLGSLPKSLKEPP